MKLSSLIKLPEKKSTPYSQKFCNGYNEAIDDFTKLLDKEVDINLLCNKKLEEENEKLTQQLNEEYGFTSGD